MKSLILMVIDHPKPVSDLMDKVAGRAYTLDGVTDVRGVDVSDILTVPRPLIEKILERSGK